MNSKLLTVVILCMALSAPAFTAYWLIKGDEADRHTLRIQYCAQLNAIDGLCTEVTQAEIDAYNESWLRRCYDGAYPRAPITRGCAAFMRRVAKIAGNDD